MERRGLYARHCLRVGLLVRRSDGTWVAASRAAIVARSDEDRQTFLRKPGLSKGESQRIIRSANEGPFRGDFNADLMAFGCDRMAAMLCGQFQQDDRAFLL